MLSHADKVELIRGYLDMSGLKVMVETGLYGGGGSGMNFLSTLERYIVLDKDPQNCATAREYHPAQIAAGTVSVVEGDSGARLPGVLRRLDGPAFFWLDAHLVVDIDEVDALDQWPCPLLRELEAVRAWPWAFRSTVLIDDVRLFGSYGWPDRASVLAACDGWAVHEAQDILCLTPHA